MIKRILPILASLAASSLAACSHVPPMSPVSTVPIYQQKTAVEKALAAAPPPTQAIPVAVYGFVDQTGQFKTTNTGQNLSRAVSQGGGAMLSDPCRRRVSVAGSRSWNASS